MSSKRYTTEQIIGIVFPHRAIRQRDETGERSVSLSKMVLYYKTHLALLRKMLT
jgi:hypothetical protein